MIAYLLMVFVVFILSFWGGLWLWQQLSSTLNLKKINIVVGASSLFVICLLVSLLMAKQIFLVKAMNEQLMYYLLILNLSILYNLGYLLSISNKRSNLPAFYQYFHAELLLLPVFLIIFSWLIYQTDEVKNNDLVIFVSIFFGFLTYVSGFSIWETLRQNTVFENGVFRNTLWNLSLGFVVICIVILFVGMLAFKLPSLIGISGFLILLVFVSLTAYCMALLYASITKIS